MPSSTPRASSSEPLSIVWLRCDLRLADNPALAGAARRGATVPLYILDDASGLGGAQRWWLHHSLAALDRDLRDRGSRLVLRRGPAARVIADIIGETGASMACWNDCGDAAAIARDLRIQAELAARGVAVERFAAGFLADPGSLSSGAGRPYTVFTPFWKALRARMSPGTPQSAPRRLAAPGRWPRSESLSDWRLLPTAPDWAAGLRETWAPGEANARGRLDQFIDHGLAAYTSARARPDLDGTSMLSPHLAFGEIGPHQVWRAVATAGARDARRAAGAEAFLRELAWREFSHHLLYHHPDLAQRPLRAAFESFPWRDDAAALAAWQRGRTGYPVVDAGMRQLWRTGWMHNRVRMIVASFLVKDLMLPWRQGAAWFHDTLVDADPANNVANWQWVAGCGADAAPYFRVFNPVLQGRKFDPDGAYVRRHVPELARLPAAWIHEPWRAPPSVVSSAGLALGRDYPLPIVDHGVARARAIAAWRGLPRRAA